MGELNAQAEDICAALQTSTHGVRDGERHVEDPRRKDLDDDDLTVIVATERFEVRVVKLF